MMKTDFQLEAYYSKILNLIQTQIITHVLMVHVMKWKQK